ncbi:MAG: hypothetical protein IJD69_04470 [Alphaproteobacteria bacterium]|nr:hypothetical protein [Alphaproteobacteria bacterium]
MPNLNVGLSLAVLPILAYGVTYDIQGRNMTRISANTSYATDVSGVSVRCTNTLNVSCNNFHGVRIASNTTSGTTLSNCTFVACLCNRESYVNSGTTCTTCSNNKVAEGGTSDYEVALHNNTTCNYCPLHTYLNSYGTCTECPDAGLTSARMPTANAKITLCYKPANIIFDFSDTKGSGTYKFTQNCFYTE